MHYVATARMMAECVGSALAEDFADASIKDVLAAGLPAANTQPFGAGDGKGWAEFKVTPAHRALALRVQGRAQDSCMSCAPPWGPWLRGGALRRAMPRAPRAAATSRRRWARWQNMCRRRVSRWIRKRRPITCPLRSRPLVPRWRARVGGGAAAARAGADQGGRARRLPRRGPPDGGGHASFRKAREGVTGGARAGRARRGVRGIGRGSQGPALFGERRG